MAVRLMPPLSFFLKPILGGLLFRRIPNPSSSFSIIFLWPRGFSTSRTIRMRLQVRATKNYKKKVISQKACSHNLRQNNHNMDQWTDDTMKPLKASTLVIFKYQCRTEVYCAGQASLIDRSLHVVRMTEAGKHLPVSIQAPDWGQLTGWGNENSSLV